MKLAQWFWRRRFFKFVNIFSQFRKYLPLGKGGALHFNKLESRTPKELCAKFGWNWPSGSGKDDFSNLFFFFHNLVIIFTSKKTEPFIWTNVNPFTLKCIVPCWVEIGPVVLEGWFFKFVNLFSQFQNFPLLEKDRALHLYKFESTSPKDNLYQVWLKLTEWFLRKWF